MLRRRSPLLQNRCASHVAISRDLVALRSKRMFLENVFRYSPLCFPGHRQKGLPLHKCPSSMTLQGHHLIRKTPSKAMGSRRGPKASAEKVTLDCFQCGWLCMKLYGDINSFSYNCSYINPYTINPSVPHLTWWTGLVPPSTFSPKYLLHFQNPPKRKAGSTWWIEASVDSQRRN